MFTFSEILFITCIITFAIDNGFKKDLIEEDITKITIIERKLLALKPKTEKA